MYNISFWFINENNDNSKGFELGLDTVGFWEFIPENVFLAWLYFTKETN